MGSGGARYGAGRPGWRRKCKQSLPLDIRALHRRGRLQSGASFGWRWTSDGEPCGNIGLRAGDHSLELSYTWTPGGGQPTRMRYDVQLERTRCRFGGLRSWFRCPWCGRRCVVLYGLSGDGYFGCRRCLNLAYASEAEDAISRLWRKTRKLEARLTEDGDRPKGMHWRTYHRICDQLDAVEEAKDRAFAIAAAAILRRTGMTLDDILK
jgi:hypothetical protein